MHLNDISYLRDARFDTYALLRLQGLLRLFSDLNTVFLQLGPGTLLGLLASVGIWKDWECEYDIGMATANTHCVKWPYDRR